MSHRPRRKPKKATNTEWQRLSEDKELRRAFLRLSRSIKDAQERIDRQGLPVSHIDLREAGTILASYPQLSSYLLDIRERMESERDAEERIAIKTSPTGDHPQASALGSWSFYSESQPQGIPNARYLREWAEQSEWTNAAINYYCERIGRADVDVLPIDERLPYNRETMKSLKLLFDQPNELGDTWPKMVRAQVRDLLTLGRGVWSKNMNAKRQSVSIYIEDTAKFKIYVDWNGDPNQPHYLYESAQSKVPLRDDEIVCPMYGASSYRYSLSPVQVLRNTIIADLKATESAARLVDQKPPPQIIQIPGASASQIKTLSAEYRNEIAGQREILFLGGANPAVVKPLVFSLKDNQWMEWLEYLARKICVVMGLSHQTFSFITDVNRSTAESQQDLEENKGLIPLMLLLEEEYNRHIIADFAPKLPMNRTNINALNLCLLFPEISETARQMHARNTIELAATSLAGLPSQTINAVLMAQGLEPLPHGGNTFWLKTATGAIPWLSYDNDFGPGFTKEGMPVGTQDILGGPDSTEDSEEDIGTQPNEDTVDSNEDTENNESSENTTVSSGDTESSNETKHFIDYRRPGYRWNNTSVQRARRQTI